jgi:hypothetical protein
MTSLGHGCERTGVVDQTRVKTIVKLRFAGEPVLVSSSEMRVKRGARNSISGRSSVLSERKQEVGHIGEIANIEHKNPCDVAVKADSIRAEATFAHPREVNRCCIELTDERHHRTV